MRSRRSPRRSTATRPSCSPRTRAGRQGPFRRGARVSRRVVVVGGGVAGLATACRLMVEDRRAEVALLEASERVGGKLRSIEVGDLTLEAGADSFVARRPWAV